MQPVYRGVRRRNDREKGRRLIQGIHARERTVLTVLIPCKNELRQIEACIASARLLGGEILVADSGSTDGTLDVVAHMPDCRLIERPFSTYADFKNWAIPQASHPWVFVLDADERVTPELADEVRRT